MMSQNDPCGGDNFAAEDNVTFDDELLAIDVDSLVAAEETQRVEQAMDKLKEIVATLANCHAVTSLPLSTEQLERFSRCSFWADTFSAEMRNVRASAIDNINTQQ